jgi:hypothetical protein
VENLPSGKGCALDDATSFGAWCAGYEAVVEARHLRWLQPLEAPETATTVRRRGGKSLMQDGSYAARIRAARSSIARCRHHETAAADAGSTADHAHLHGTRQAAGLKTPSHGLQRPQSSPRGLPRLCPVRAVDKERGPGRVRRRLRTGGKKSLLPRPGLPPGRKLGERQDNAAMLREAIAATPDVARPLSASTDTASEVSVTAVLPDSRIGTKQQEAPKLWRLAPWSRRPQVKLRR